MNSLFPGILLSSLLVITSDLKLKTSTIFIDFYDIVLLLNRLLNLFYITVIISVFQFICKCSVPCVVLMPILFMPPITADHAADLQDLDVGKVTRIYLSKCCEFFLSLSTSHPLSIREGERKSYLLEIWLLYGYVGYFICSLLNS